MLGVVVRTTVWRTVVPENHWLGPYNLQQETLLRSLLAELSSAQEIVWSRLPDLLRCVDASTAVHGH